MLTQSSGRCETAAFVSLETRKSVVAVNSIYGFAASRAESLWLSVRPSNRERLRLARRSREQSCALDGKPEAFRTGGGKAAKRGTQSNQTL
jgi:hypothetical protein